MSNWFLQQLVEDVQSRLGDEFPVTTDVPANQSVWIAIPVFGVAKQRGEKLEVVANDVASKLTDLNSVDVEIVGGFVNLTPNNVSHVLEESGDESYGNSELAKDQTVVIEFSGTNIAKPMSIGHLRSTLIGDSLQRIFRTLGATVTSVNHLGDWGTQFGKLLVAYQAKYGDLRPRPVMSMQEMLELYVGFHTDAEDDEALNDEARAMFKRLEGGDEEVRTVWESMVTASLVEFDKIFQRLGVTMDEPRHGESTYESLLPEIISLAKDKGIAKESDGALVVEVPGEDTPLMLVKQDGATLYATRDLAQVKFRVDTYHPNKILYCVGNEQALHFRQYFAVARLLGIVPDSTELVHVKNGLVRLPEGKMSTRKGHVIFLEDLLDESVRRAREIVEDKNPDLSSQEKDTIAEVVGIGALKYFDLSHDRKNDIVFDWDRVLSLKGDSAPYLQYSYVRAISILSKAKPEESSTDEVQLDKFSTDVQQLVRSLARFPFIIQKAADQYAPHTLAQYLNDVATQFNSFYEQYPVLTAKEEDKALRVAIVQSAANVLKRGLELLGIQVLERM